jgi:hypothetical protein
VGCGMSERRAYWLGQEDRIAARPWRYRREADVKARRAYRRGWASMAKALRMSDILHGVGAA